MQGSQKALQGQIWQTEEQIANLQHVVRVAEAMAPDPREWEYTGEVLEGDPTQCKCACGHPIKYLFPIVRRRDNKVVIIGSVCIEKTVPYLIEYGAQGLAESLMQAYQKHKELLAEIERREREAKNNEVVQQLTAYGQSLQEWFKELARRVKASGKRFYWPYYFYNREYAKMLETMSTPGRTAASMRKKIRTFLEQAEVLRKDMYDQGIPGLWQDYPVADPSLLVEGSKKRG